MHENKGEDSNVILWTQNIVGPFTNRSSKTALDTQTTSLPLAMIGEYVSTANVVDCLGRLLIDRKQSLARCPDSWHL